MSALRYGVCASYADLPFLTAVRKLGFDAVEPALFDLAKEEESAVRRYARERESIGLACASFNGMIPGDYRLFGSGADEGALREYLERAFSYAALYGAPLITFGSSRPRMIPDGMTREEAEERFCAVLADTILPIAEKNGLKIGIEPLCTAECNYLNTCPEIAEVVRKVASPTLGLTVDYYHAVLGGDSVADMIACPSLFHVHLASPKRDRFYPNETDKADLAAFFEGLCSVGFAGVISLEGSTGKDRPGAAETALAVMRSAL